MRTSSWRRDGRRPCPPADLPRRPLPRELRNPYRAVCFDCVHVAVDVQTCLYALARCELLPGFGPFGLHWTACPKFAMRPALEASHG